MPRPSTQNIAAAHTLVGIKSGAPPTKPVGVVYTPPYAPLPPKRKSMNRRKSTYRKTRRANRSRNY